MPAGCDFPQPAAIHTNTPGSPDRKATFAALTPTHCVRCLKTYPSELVSCGRSHATFAALTPPASPSLSCSPSESPPALRENRRYSPASAGSELTAGDLRIFPGLENATAGAVSHYGLKSCDSRLGLSTICFANRDKSPSEASRSTEGALSQRTCELRKVPCNVRIRSLQLTSFVA